MAFPTVEGSGSQSTLTDTTAHPIPYPTVTGGIKAGDLLLVFGAADGTGTVSNWDGFTQLGTGLASGSTARGVIAYKWAVGTESGTINVTITSPRKATWITYCIRGAEPTSNPEASASLVGSSTAPNAGSVTPTWGAADTLWFSTAAVDLSAGATIVATGAPPSYTGLFSINANSTTSASISVARRTLNAASEDPGAFTLSATEQWIAWTVAVRPVVPALVTRTLSYSAAGAYSTSRVATLRRTLSYAAAGSSSVLAATVFKLALTYAAGASYAPTKRVSKVLSYVATAARDGSSSVTTVAAHALSYTAVGSYVVDAVKALPLSPFTYPVAVKNAIRPPVGQRRRRKNR